MKSLAILLARFVSTFRIEPDSNDAVLCSETVDALAGFYGDGPVPALDLPFIEELFLNRFLAARFEAHLGERGLFVKKGDDPQGALHPAVNAAIRARGRDAKILRALAKQYHATKGNLGVAPVDRAVEPANSRTLHDAGIVPAAEPLQHGQDAHPTSEYPPVSVPPALNGHSVAPVPDADTVDCESPKAVFMNRAMRRLAERNASKSERKEKCTA